MNEIDQIPLIVWILIVLVLSVQGFWVFNDAKKRGMNKWIWGIFALLNTPSNLIIYLIVSRKYGHSEVCINCGKRLNSRYDYCPHCGVKHK